MKKMSYFFVFYIFLLSSPIFANCQSNGPTAHFKVQNEYVVDDKKNLIWARCSVGQKWKKNLGCTGQIKIFTLTQALKEEKKAGKGWRLPTAEELYSLLDETCKKRPYNQQIFPNIDDLGEGASYWTTTQIPEMPILYFYINFIDGSIDGHTENFSLGLRLVKAH